MIANLVDVLMFGLVLPLGGIRAAIELGAPPLSGLVLPAAVFAGRAWLRARDRRIEAGLAALRASETASRE